MYRIFRRFFEEGSYFMVSKKFGMRRYVFPMDTNVQQKVANDMRKVCKAVMNGTILPYPFLQDRTETLANRVVCFFYDRKDPKQEPIAFHAPFITKCDNMAIYHVGLVMVRPEYQHQGLQILGACNASLFFLLHGFNFIFTDIGSSSSYLTVMERTQKEYFPDWTKPESKPEPWQLKVAQFMLNNHREDFGCSSTGQFDENTFVIKGGHSEEASDGADQLKSMFATRQSKDKRKQAFIDNRLNNENGDLQFFVGKPDNWKLFVKFTLGR